MRLVTTGRPDAQGRLQGALDIELKQGWKTYWRDPGDNGVPPQLGIDGSTNVTGAEMSFPAPRRHDDGYGQWAGYDHSVSLPILFTLAAPQGQTKIDARIFIGICETICIPVQAKLEVDPGTDPDNGADAQAVEAALAALPREAHPGFRAVPGGGNHETLVVQADVPGDPGAADFFIAGADDYMFGAPVRSERAGKLVFSVPILDRPSTPPTNGGLHYTLTSSGGAVRGVLPYP